MGYNKLLFLLITGILSANLDDYISQINQNIIDVKFQDASQLFTKALSEYDASAKLYYIGAQLSIKTDDLDQANKYLIKAIELDPKNDKFRDSQQQLSEFKDDLTKAKKTFDSGFTDNAIIEYEKLKIKYPQYAIVFYNLGLLYKVVKDYDYAVENYQHAKKLNPFEVKYSLAIKAISQIIAKEGDEEYRRHEFDSAINNYQKAISYYPQYTTAIFKLARTYYKLREYENAQEYLEQGIEVDPNQEQSEKMLGDIYMWKDNTEQALIHYKRSIEINSKYFQAFYSLGTLFLSEGLLDDAREAFNQAILIEPTYSKAYGSLGAIEQELGNIDIAIDNYLESIEYDKRAYDIYYRLSSAYNINKQYKKAKFYAKESIDIKRHYAPAHFELGIAERYLGNKIAARNAFENAKKDRNWRKLAEFQLDLISKGL